VYTFPQFVTCILTLLLVLVWFCFCLYFVLYDHFPPECLGLLRHWGLRAIKMDDDRGESEISPCMS